MSRSHGPAHPHHLDDVRGGGLRLRAFGIALVVRPTAPLVLMLVGWLVHRHLLAIVVWPLVGVLALMAHELGHALVARAAGANPASEITWRGGVTRWPGPRTLGTRAAVLVMAAGPLTGLVVATLVWQVAVALGVTLPLGPAPDADAVALALDAAVLLSLGAAAMDLLPALPLDAGRALTALLPGTRFERQMRVASIGAVVATMAAIALVISPAPLLAAVPAWFAGTNLWIVLRGDRAIGPRPEEALAKGDFQAIRRRVEAGVDGLEVAVRAQRAARAALDHGAAADIGIAALGRGWGFHDLALLTAGSFAVLGHGEQAVTYAQRAVAMGADPSILLRDRDLASFAHLPGFPVKPQDTRPHMLGDPLTDAVQTRTSTWSRDLRPIEGTSAPSAGQPTGNTT